MNGTVHGAGTKRKPRREYGKTAEMILAVATILILLGLVYGVWEAANKVHQAATKIPFQRITTAIKRAAVGTVGALVWMYSR